MVEHPAQTLFSKTRPDRGYVPVERQLLALDALSKLTMRFCDKPDFEHLIELLLVTLCGQFSVADSFAILHKPASRSVSQSFFATGHFRKQALLATSHLKLNQWDCLIPRPRVRLLEELSSVDPSPVPARMLRDCGVNLVCSLVHNDRLFGVIGLGQRVTGRPYSVQDRELLDIIINTVTPLVANSYLFWELAGLNAWYLDILDNVKQGAFVFDSDFRLKTINSAGLAILSTFETSRPDVDSMIGAPIGDVFHQDGFGSWAAQVVQACRLNRGISMRSLVAKNRHTERIYNVSVTGGKEHAEIGTAIIVTLDDVTAQKENEQRLFDLQKFADKGLMASSIAHELNNFLALIMGGVEILQIAMSRGDAEKAAQTLDRLKAQVLNMERFTAGLTDYSKLAASKETGNLNKVIGDVLSFLSVQKRFKHLDIRQELDGRVAEFLMDTDQIAQLLLNLLNNAADAIEEAQRREGCISIKTIHDGPNAVLVISDNGVGVDPEVKDRLFKARMTTKQRGHGYGLITCAKIVESHHGTISVDSEAGRGTTFTISFAAGA